MVNGDPQFLSRQTQCFGQEIPAVLDCLTLEVVAEAEVAEHLEERVVTHRVADVFEVVVLAAGADATLRRHGPVIAALVFSKEDILELHHARVREQQGRVIAGHERRTRDHLVAALTKKRQESLAKLIARHGLHRDGFYGYSS